MNPKTPYAHGTPDWEAIAGERKQIIQDYAKKTQALTNDNHELEKDIMMLKAEIEAQRHTITSLENQNAFLKAQIRMAYVVMGERDRYEEDFA